MKTLITMLMNAGFVSSISLPVFALEETSQRPELAISTMLGSLILVLSCIFLFGFLMKKSNLIRYGGNSNPIKMIATQVVTNKSRIQIIEVRGKQYLLGVSEQSINLLDQLDIAINDSEPQAEKQTTASLAPSLASVFANVLSKTGKNNE